LTLGRLAQLGHFSRLGILPGLDLLVVVLEPLPA
jgi:hypothetical protein